MAKRKPKEPELDPILIAETVPSVWIETNLYNANTMDDDGKSMPFVLRDYQRLIMDDENTHRVLSLGRQVGKSMMLSIDAIYRTATNPNTTAVIITPYKAQVRKLFDDIAQVIEASPFVELVTSRMSPTMEFILANKSKIQLFTAAVSSGGNADQIRGFKANFLYLDEADYIPDNAMEAVMMVTASIQNPRIWISSTPTGRKGYFYKVFHDPLYKNFNFSSWVNPNWDEKKDLAARLSLSQIGYEHEVLAQFTSNEQGVFLKHFVDYAFDGQEEENTYGSLGDKDYDFKYIGIDWNAANNGVQIAVVGANMPTEPNQIAKLALIDKIEVKELEYTQTTAIHKILELNKKHNPTMIYADAGFGGMQLEVMHRMGYADPTTGLDQKLKSIDFGGTTDIFDPIVGLMIKKRNKVLMVDNLARLLERQMLVLPADEKGDGNLEYALINYSIVRVSPNGAPVYECINCPDHFLMAFMLAVNAFYLHQGAFADPTKLFKASVPRLVAEPVVRKMNRINVATELEVRGLQTRASLFGRETGKTLADLDNDPGDTTPSRRLEYFRPGSKGSVLNQRTILGGGGRRGTGRSNI